MAAATTCLLAMAILTQSGKPLPEKVPAANQEWTRLPVREPPATFMTPSGRVMNSLESADSGAVTVYRGRYAVTAEPPTYLATATAARTPILFICRDHDFDPERVAIRCEGVIAVKLGNLLLEGERARAGGNELVVEGEKVRLFRISPNLLGTPIQEMTGEKLTIDLKKWRARAGDGPWKELIPPKEPKPPEKRPRAM